jgi:hypothetical protein
MIISWALIIVGALGAIKIFTMRSKTVMDINKYFVALVMVGIFAIGAVQLGWTEQWGLSPFFGTVVSVTGEGSTGGTSGGTLDVCDKSTKTTVTLSSVDAYTDAPAGTTHRYRLNGAPALTVSNAGTLTASPGDSLEVLFGNETDGTYYGSKKVVAIPCTGSYTVSDKLYRNGTVTIKVYNTDSNLITETGGAQNQSLTAGDVKTLKATIEGTFERGLPYGGVLVVESNKTSMDDVIVSLGGQETTVPTLHSVTFGGEGQRRAFTIPPILSTQMLEGTITLDVDDTNSPGEVIGDAVKLTLYANDLYIDEAKGGVIVGPAPEDEDQKQTFLQTTLYTLGVK